MKNLTEYGDFKNRKHTAQPVVEQVTEPVVETIEEVNEGAQLFDATWKVRTRVEIPTSLINAYVKKVQQDTGEDPRKKWSEQELAEEITKYVTTSYLTIENLPVTIVANASAEPKVQTQEEMPAETQVQPPAQGEGEVKVQVEPAQGQPPVQGSEAVAQTVPQAQKPAQTPAQAPTQAI